MTETIPEKLLIQVNHQLGSGPCEARIIEQRRRFLGSISAYRPNYRVWIFSAASVAAAVTLIVFALPLFGTREIPFEIGPRNVAGVVGQWVGAPEKDPVLIRFEGGSEFRLDPQAAARVAGGNTKTVTLDLTNGRVVCNVVGNRKTAWIVRAGDNRVRAIGTQYSVAWNPSTTRFDVDVTEGSVLVNGATLSEHGVKLFAGQHLTTVRDQTTITHRTKPDVEQPHAEIVDHDSVTGNPDDAGRNQRNKRAHTPQLTEKTPKPDWKDLYGEKDYSGAVDAAVDDGLNELIDGLRAGELWNLAQAARYARRGDIAQNVLLGFKTRFPASKRARHATFLLGRVSLELQGNPTSAINWFERYLETWPSGPLAEEALGRLIEVCRSNGRQKKARKYARIYLTRFPDGPFARLAHTTVE